MVDSLCCKCYSIYSKLPHPWTRPTYDAKRHPDPIRHFSTMHRTDRRTYGPTDHSRESLTTIGHCDPRATRPNNNYNNDDNVIYKAPVCRGMTVAITVHDAG